MKQNASVIHLVSYQCTPVYCAFTRMQVSSDIHTVLYTLSVCVCVCTVYIYICIYLDILDIVSVCVHTVHVLIFN